MPTPMHAAGDTVGPMTARTNGAQPDPLAAAPDGYQHLSSGIDMRA